LELRFEYVKYKNKDGKIIIQPKEELFKDGIPSPNCVDAAVLTMAVSDTMIKSNRVRMTHQGGFHDQTEAWWGSDNLQHKRIGTWPN